MPLPTPEDYAKEPPAMPPHLQLTLLNVPPALDATASLPRPQVPLEPQLDRSCILTDHAFGQPGVGQPYMVLVVDILLRRAMRCKTTINSPVAMSPWFGQLCSCERPATAIAPGIASMQLRWFAARAARHPEPPVLPAQRARHQRNGGGRDAPLQKQVCHHRAVQAAAPRRPLHAARRRQRRQHAAHERLRRPRRAAAPASAAAVGSSSPLLRPRRPRCAAVPAPAATV